MFKTTQDKLITLAEGIQKGKNESHIIDIRTKLQTNNKGEFPLSLKIKDYRLINKIVNPRKDNNFI